MIIHIPLPDYISNICLLKKKILIVEKSLNLFLLHLFQGPFQVLGLCSPQGFQLSQCQAPHHFQVLRPFMLTDGPRRVRCEGGQVIRKGLEG